MEEWKQIEDYPRYEVSNMGNVRRRDRPEHLFSTRPDSKTGYVRVTLARAGRNPGREQVHRLVARSFLGEHRRGAHVNHKDGDKSNNRVENLEWCTPQENVAHAWRMGLCVSHKGSGHGMAKLCESDVDVIRSADARGVEHKKIAEVFNVTAAAVSAIVRGVTWKHTVTGLAADTCVES